MDAKTVRDTIVKPKLVEVFGNAIANLLVTKSMSAGMKGTNEQEKLQLMLDSICSDNKVIGMWGEAQTAKHKQSWMSALK